MCFLLCFLVIVEPEETLSWWGKCIFSPKQAFGAICEVKLNSACFEWSRTSPWVVEPTFLFASDFRSGGGPRVCFGVGNGCLSNSPAQHPCITNLHAVSAVSIIHLEALGRTARPKRSLLSSSNRGVLVRLGRCGGVQLSIDLSDACYDVLLLKSNWIQPQQ